MTHYQRPGLVPLAVPPTTGLAGTAASQTLTFNTNPSPGDTITLNGSVWTFVASGATGNQFNIGGTTGITIALNVLPALAASTDPAIILAAYSSSGGPTVVVMTITYKAVGVVGNSYTVAASAATPGGATLVGGVDPTLTGGPGPARALFQASDGSAWAVVGEWLYNVTLTAGTWAMIPVGQLTQGRTNPCSIVDNGLQLVVVDGAPADATGTGGGWTVQLDVRGNFAVISDPAWTGADKVDVIDGFVIWNQPGTQEFGSTLNNVILPLDPTYLAGKTDYSDPLATLVVNRHEILLLGTQKSEIWYDAGNPLFPFAELPGAFIEHGVRAIYSVATADINVYWLCSDLQGSGMVLRQRGYETKRISNHALEFAIRQMREAGTIDDAVGFTYQQDGHVFYVLSFPTGNQTWVWDESVGDPQLGWHQETFTDQDGGQNRSRAVFGAYLFGVNCVLDWQNGTLYQQSLTTYTDTVEGVEYPIRFLRTFPHLMSGIAPATGQPILADGKMVTHYRFLLDAECGNGPTDTGEGPPKFMLRWSDDRGRTWGQSVALSAGTNGEFGTRPEVTQLGTAMDRVYEVSWTFPGQVALNGAWVEGVVANR